MRFRARRFAKAGLSACSVLLAACAPSVFARDVRGDSARATAPASEPAAHDFHDEPALKVEPAPQQPAIASLDTEPVSAALPQAEPVPAAQTPLPAAEVLGPATAPELLRLDRGVGEVPLLLPRQESLVYEVHLNLGWIGSPTVGKVTMTSEVGPFYAAAPGGTEGEQVLLKGRAEGSYQVYTLDNTISSALLPQTWPRTVHRNVQTGTENRQRETMLGQVDGKEVSRYRSDGHCKGCKDKAHYESGTWPWQDDKHCKKCKAAEHRVWREPRTRDIPPGTLDMLTAVFLARSLVIDGRDKVEFSLIDRTDLWQVQLLRGRSKSIETTAGKFQCVEVQLKTSAAESAGESETTKFEGLFGIHGTISIWMEAHSGVPVRIEGSVPAGPINLDVAIELRSARGAPRVFSAGR